MQFIRKSDPIRSYLCSGGLIWGASHNILKFNYFNYSSLDLYQKRCVLYKLFISLRCMNESPTVGCVSTGSRRCVYKSFSLSRFKVCSLKIGVDFCWLLLVTLLFVVFLDMSIILSYIIWSYFLLFVVIFSII